MIPKSDSIAAAMTRDEVRAIPARRFRRAWEEMGITQIEFCKRLTDEGARTDTSDFSRMQTGSLRLTEERLAALVNVTGHELAWFFSENGHEPL